MSSSKPGADDSPGATQELERLSKLRRDVAAGLLEVSKSARHDAEALFAAERESQASASEPARDDPAPDDDVQTDGSIPANTQKRRLYGTFAAGLAAGIAIAVVAGSFDTGPPSSVITETRQATPEVAIALNALEAVDAAPPPAQPEEPEPVSEPAPEPAREPTPTTATQRAPRADVLVVTLTAIGPCWISARVDNEDTPIERLLLPDETIVLEAYDEAVLRIGDAAAMSLLINDRPVRPLGTEGQVVTLRITPTNFRTFLRD